MEDSEFLRNIICPSNLFSLIKSFQEKQSKPFGLYVEAQCRKKIQKSRGPANNIRGKTGKLTSVLPGFAK